MTAAFGDAKLAQALRSWPAGRAGRPIGAAQVSEGTVVAASLGADLDADFEIGSVSKGLTGMLYVDSVARGEVRPESTLGDFLDLAGAPAGDVPLMAVSTHTSGLPRLPRDPAVLRKTWQLWRHGANPYRDDLPTLLRRARATRLRPPKHRYSNLGFQLLGHALAAAAGTTYAGLLEERIAAPLGLRATYAPTTPAQLRPSALAGASRRGRPAQPWTGEGLGPAGGVRSSVAALGPQGPALLDGTAPGVAALDRVYDVAPHAGIGAAWMTLDARHRSITWHNGRTGGFSCWVGLDRRAGTGVAVVAASARNVDRPGFSMLASLERHEH
jgi:CubicO group peptidase (beta-lactamase class C family)